MSGKKPITIPTAWTPIAELELLPGDVCDIEDAGTVAMGRLYLERISDAPAFDSGGSDRYWWPSPAAMVRITRSPNRERKAEKHDRDRDVVDPLLGGGRR